MLKTTLTSSLVALTLLSAANGWAESRHGAHRTGTLVVRTSAEPAARRRVAARVVVPVVRPVPAQRAVVTVTRHDLPAARRSTTLYRAPAAPVMVHTRAAEPRVVVTRRPAVRVTYTSASPRVYQLDRNRNGVVSWPEARHAGWSFRAFRQADRNRDGMLTRYETRTF